MRKPSDRRKADTDPSSVFADNGRTELLRDRRKGRDRRIANLPLEERQLQLSEMPGPTPDKTR